MACAVANSSRPASASMSIFSSSGAVCQRCYRRATPRRKSNQLLCRPTREHLGHSRLSCIGNVTSQRSPAHMDVPTDLCTLPPVLRPSQQTMPHKHGYTMCGNRVLHIGVQHKARLVRGPKLERCDIVIWMKS